MLTIQSRTKENPPSKAEKVWKISQTTFFNKSSVRAIYKVYHIFGLKVKRIKLKWSRCCLRVWWHHFNSLWITYSAYKRALLPFPLSEGFTEMSVCLKLTHSPHCWWERWLDNASILNSWTYSLLKVRPKLFLENIRRKHHFKQALIPLLLLAE